MALVLFWGVRCWTVTPGNQAPLMSLTTKDTIIVTLIACLIHHKWSPALAHMLTPTARGTYFPVVTMSLEVEEVVGGRTCTIIKCNPPMRVIHNKNIFVVGPTALPLFMNNLNTMVHRISKARPIFNRDTVGVGVVIVEVDIHRLSNSGRLHMIGVVLSAGVVAIEVGVVPGMTMGSWAEVDVVLILKTNSHNPLSTIVTHNHHLQATIPTVRELRSERKRTLTRFTRKLKLTKL